MVVLNRRSALKILVLRRLQIDRSTAWFSTITLSPRFNWNLRPLTSLQKPFGIAGEL